MAGKNKAMLSSAWRSLNVASHELRLDFTLQGGQSFRWHLESGSLSESTWTGVVGDRIWTLSQDNVAGRLLYKVHPEPLNSEEVSDCEFSLKDYFQLEAAVLADLYDEWSTSDVHFRMIASNYPGVRVLRQDPVENLFSFLCSSNNNIKRITGMVESLCTLYGRKLGSVNGQTYYRFPDVESLASDCVAERLRAEKFGYRAKFIQGAARKLVDDYRRGSKSTLSGSVDESLRRLRSVSYEEARNALMTLPGVGPKVADCVCLMSLDKTNVVPVDTHIFKLAKHLYLSSPDDVNNPSRKSKSLTKKKYDEIGKHFHNVFGEYAGWAHSVLFTSDLSRFKTEDKLPVKNGVKQLKRCSESTLSHGRKSSKKASN